MLIGEAHSGDQSYLRLVYNHRHDGKVRQRVVAHLGRKAGNAERRVIIVFSDGSDRGSASSPLEVIRAAGDANVQIYGVRFQPSKEAAENYIYSSGLSGVISGS